MDVLALKAARNVLHEDPALMAQQKAERLAREGAYTGPNERVIWKSNIYAPSTMMLAL